MTTTEVKKQIRAKGILKVIIGLLMCIVTPLVLFLGVIAKLVGGICIIVGAVMKVFEIFAQNDPAKQQFWKERTEKFMHFGAVAFLGGWALTIKYLAGVIVIAEGVYNAIKFEDKHNCIEYLDKASKFISAFISGLKAPNFSVNASKSSAKSKAEKIIDAKILEEKPTKKSASDKTEDKANTKKASSKKTPK